MALLPARITLSTCLLAYQRDKISKHLFLLLFLPLFALTSWQDEVKSYIGSHVANGSVGREGRDCRGNNKGRLCPNGNDRSNGRDTVLVTHNR